MIGRRTTIFLSLLCALLFGAFAASSAMATPGTTAHTCTQSGTATSGTDKFDDEHCTKINNSTGKWRHVEIPVNTPTKVTGTNAKTGTNTESAVTATLKAKAFGTTLTISATGVSSEGTLTNETGPPMKASGPATIRYTGVEVTSLPLCTIKGGEVIAEANVRTATNATEMWVEAEGKKPEEVFAEFTIEGGKLCALDGAKVRVRGTVIGTPNGATLEFKEKEAKNTCRIGFEKEGTCEYIAVETVRMKEGDPIAATTTAS